MEVTQFFLEKQFRHFNSLIFKGRLPVIPIELTDVRTYLGLCLFKRRRLPGGKWIYSDFRLRFNTRIDLPQEEIEDVLIHEMIHLLIAFNQQTDTSPHGGMFLSLMREINSRFGRHVKVSHRNSAHNHSVSAASKIKWHVIALLIPACQLQGKAFVKVLPRVASSVVRYYSAFIADPGISSIELFLSCDPFFDRYPNSSALRAHECSESEIRLHLHGARSLGILNGKLTVIRS